MKRNNLLRSFFLLMVFATGLTMLTRYKHTYAYSIVTGTTIAADSSVATVGYAPNGAFGGYWHNAVTAAGFVLKGIGAISNAH